MGNSKSEFAVAPRASAAMHDKNESGAVEPVQLGADDGVFELAGSPPAWISVFTCPILKCQCRTALVLATDDGPEKLRERAVAVRDAWNSGTDYRKTAEAIEDLTTFHIDFYTTEVYATSGGLPLDVQAHPRIADVANRIDGDLLDSIGSHWFRGKGWPDPAQRVLDIAATELIAWQAGDMVAWNEICDIRQDLYVLDGRVYEASEMYCPVPGCDCGEVFIGFEVQSTRGAPSPGHVVVQQSGATEVIPIKKGRDRLERLWGAFRQRHPNHLARFARRYPIMKTVGERSLNLPVSVAPKIGRNEACPCGSGKKYKRCCGAN